MSYICNEEELALLEDEWTVEDEMVVDRPISGDLADPVEE